jgi:hypothetical protein
MTPREMEALTVAELVSELATERGEQAWPYGLLTHVRDVTAHAAALYPIDALEAPESLAHDIASGTDWGQENYWQPAYDLAKVLLRAYTPEEH